MKKSLTLAFAAFAVVLSLSTGVDAAWYDGACHGGDIDCWLMTKIAEWWVG